MRWTVKIVVGLALLMPGALRAQSVDDLIQSLADPNPARRQDAQNQLRRLDTSARPALISASRGENPAVASAAAQLLLSLAWSRASDSIEVKTELSPYGLKDVPDRIAIIDRIGKLADPIGKPVLLRLIVEIPSEEVCWKIVQEFWSYNPYKSHLHILYGFSPDILEQIRRMNPSGTRPAALFLCGAAWYWKDYEKSMDLFRRAVAAESAQPSYDGGEMDFAFEELIDAEEAAGHLDQALMYAREYAARVGTMRDAYPTPIERLFLLHGRYGPLDGFDNDVRQYQDYLGDPAILYSIGQAYRRAGRTLEAMACEQTALAEGLTSLSRRNTASFLIGEARWNDLARHESYAILTNREPELEAIDALYYARHWLASIATDEQDDAAVIEHASALQSMTEEAALAGQPRGADESRQWAASGRRHSALLAKAKGDHDGILHCLDQLVDIKPVDTESVQLAYPLFIAEGRAAQAKALFDAAYEDSQRQIAENPDEPMLRNDLAWLCARCDQKLDEALSLAQTAVARCPNNAALIDTLAEVQFRRGNFPEAVKLETRALTLEPETVYMQRQLVRFQAAANSSH